MSPIWKMPSVLNTAGLLLLLVGSSVGQKLNRPVLFTDGLSPHVDSIFFQHLKPTQSTWDQWDWGWIPQACLDFVQGTQFSPYDMEIYNVHYTDCDQPWTFCRHHDAQMSIIEMIDVFGRQAVRDRSWTRNVVAVPADGCSAGTAEAVSIFYGPCYIPSVWTHEMSHTLDGYVNDQTGVPAWSIQDSHTYSTSSTAWSQAINKDSCVPDDYANSNVVEDFAQVSVLALFEKVNPGGLDPIGPWRCLVNQKNLLDSVIGNELTPGGSCIRRWADSATVSMGPAAGNTKRSVWSKRDGRKAGPKPEPAIKVGDPLVNSQFPEPETNSLPLQIDVFNNLVTNNTAKVEATLNINMWNSQVGKPTVPVPSS